MSAPWDFEQWFVAQHGPRPDTINAALLRDRVEAQERGLARDKALLARIEEWEARRTTALYAWQINDSDKRRAGG